MLIFIKKSNLFLVLGVLVAFIFALCLALLPKPAVKTMAVPGAGKTVIIDAGHGAPDGGAVAENGLQEKDLNLAIARFLQGYAEEGGMTVLLTRAEDQGIYDENSETIRQKKVSDMKNREEIIENSGADAFVSIHMNTYTNTRYSGPQVFYSAHHPDSKTMAEAVQKNMTEILKPLEERQVKKAGNDIYLLKKATIPAILVECGFISNSEELKKLQEESYQKQVAWSVYCGLVTYFSQG